MAKSRKSSSSEFMHPADLDLQNMTHKDLKRACIIRGMLFDEVVNGGYMSLKFYFKKHYYDPTVPQLLDEFDDWQNEEIRKHRESKGLSMESWMYAPELRLGFIAEKNEEGKVISTKRIKGIRKKKKSKRERTDDNIFSGTKKALTFELQKQGLEKSEVIKKVLEQFPDALEKSISIWFNKAKKQSKK